MVIYTCPYYVILYGWLIYLEFLTAADKGEHMKFDWYSADV